MTAEVDWVLSQFGSVVGSMTVPLKRIDRDSSTILEDNDIHKRSSELEQANYVGAGHVDNSGQPIGTEFDLDAETVVGVRIEGKYGVGREFGHIDPDGNEGIPFSELVTRLKDSLWTNRKQPNAGPADTSYTHLLLMNETPRSTNYADYYRYDFDVVFSGFETLP